MNNRNVCFTLNVIIVYGKMQHRAPKVISPGLNSSVILGQYEPSLAQPEHAVKIIRKLITKLTK